MPDGSVIDGEIVIITPRGLDFDALQLRIGQRDLCGASVLVETLDAAIFTTGDNGTITITLPNGQSITVPKPR